MAEVGVSSPPVPGKDDMFTYVEEILPDNEKTHDILVKRQAEESERLEQLQQDALRKEKRDRDAKKKRKEEDKEKDQKAKQEKERLKRLQDEEQDMKKIEGRMRNILIDIKADKSSRDITTAGMKLGPIRCGLLASSVETNVSLMSMHLSRKQLKDEEGVLMANMIKINKNMRKLEMEGNLLGPNTARAFGEALLENKTLRYLDLEGNQLQHDQNSTGIETLIDSLNRNTTLLSLNIANNDLSDMIGRRLEEVTAANKTLIDF